MTPTPPTDPSTLRWHEGTLQWVRYAGAIVHVDLWADTPPRARPETTCPICDKSVILKLGRRRVHHAAHRSDDACPARHPETADHINAKFHLAAELRRVGALALLEKCTEPLSAPARFPAQTCAQTRARPWCPGWDEVVVEERLGTLRPDLQLRREGQPVAAIEVLFSHAVPEEKAVALAALGVPWIEVSTGDVLGRSAAPWTAEQALAVVREVPQVAWTCPTHEMEGVRRQARARIATASGPLRRSLRVVDCYEAYGPGGQRRFVYWTTETWDAGEVVQVTLQHDRGAALLLDIDPSDIAARDARVEAEFTKDLRARERITGTFHDSPMPWVDPQGPPWDVPARYEWSAVQRKWVIRPGMESNCWRQRGSSAV